MKRGTFERNDTYLNDMFETHKQQIMCKQRKWLLMIDPRN